MSVRLPPGVLGMLIAFVGWVPVALAANTSGKHDDLQVDRRPGRSCTTVTVSPPSTRKKNARF